MPTQSTLWTEQLRPAHISEVVGHTALKAFLTTIVNTYTTDVSSLDRVPHLILHGPPGTGKTSLARSFAADLYPSIPASTLYLNASDERTINTVRERICAFLNTQTYGVTRQLVLFDEVETMTEPAQLTLRTLMDAPLVSGTPLPLFIFLCNTITRIVPLIRSRSLALFCGHLHPDEIGSMLARVDRVGPTALACIVHRGDMRAFLHRAQQGDDLNEWMKWFERLLRAAPNFSTAVWEYGVSKTPSWIIIRHVIVLCKEYKMCEDKAAWATFLRVVVMIREYDTLDSVVDAWEVFIAAWRAKTKHDAMIDVPHPVYPT